MAYYTNLFSPHTYEAFSSSGRTVSGFAMRQRNLAQRLRLGDKLLCYLTKVSRWVGVLTVESAVFEDHTPIYAENDPFVFRVRVTPEVWLERDKAVPIHDDTIWNRLSFTKELDKRSSQWTGKVRANLVQLDHADGAFLEDLLRQQATGGIVYPIDEDKWRKMLGQRVRLTTGEISVTIPEGEEGGDVLEREPGSEVRESIKMQALLARIGEAMGFKIWLPRADRARVLTQWTPQQAGTLLDQLPINYDRAAVSTIEQIDVIWIRGRVMARMFEVEHTTSIYSGILRMADLCALVPEINVHLHIVAPRDRREKVFQEIQRPVFAYLEKGPLAEYCTLITYDSLEELSRQSHLNRLRDDVIEDYEEEPV